MDAFPMTLAKDVAQYCEKEIERTKAEITKATDHFKTIVSPPVFEKVNNTIETNEKTRVNNAAKKSKIL